MATPDYKTTRLLLRKTTSQQDYETTSGAVAGGASQELRIGRVGSKLKAQSLSIPFYTLYTFYTLLYSLYFLYPSILSILSIPFYILYTHNSLLTVVMR